VIEQSKEACDEAQIDAPFQEGTRHIILTVLGSEFPERMLKAFSRHRDATSLGHYAKPRATRVAGKRAASDGC